MSDANAENVVCSSMSACYNKQYNEKCVLPISLPTNPNSILQHRFDENWYTTLALRL